jgi:hypothetical protein
MTMTDRKRRLLGLGLPCLVAFLLDTTQRLCLQPGAYWAGNYHYILQEGTPFIRALYTWHPLAALGGYVLWAAILTALLLLLPRPLAVMLAIAVVFGHIAGAYSWSAQLMDRYLGVVFVFTGIGLGVGLHWYLKASTHSNRRQLDRRPFSTVLRWGSIVALSAMGYYLFVMRS